MRLLLVTAVVAALVIVPFLGFMIAAVHYAESNCDKCKHVEDCKSLREKGRMSRCERDFWERMDHRL